MIQYKIHNRVQDGFSLIEMAIVLFIVALLLGGLLPTVSSQIELQHRNETKKQLDEIQQALIGFAVIKGRLPCPASTTSNGMESFCTSPFPGVCGLEILTPPQPHGRCTSPYNGFVPAATLGITPVDSKGYMVDGWNNRIHYAVTTVKDATNVYTFTAPGAMRSTGIANISSDLLVCSTATGITGLPPVCASGPPSTSLTSNPGVPVVIYSTGNNGGNGGTGADELENPNTNSANNDRLFISHTPTLAPNEFDDLVIWISPNILINRMVSAGQLP